MSGEHDRCGAVLRLTTGAGGVDAQVTFPLKSSAHGSGELA